MNFNFILDEDYISLYILSTKMYNESEEIKSIKDKLLNYNDLGYKKILGEELLDSSIYLEDNNIKKLIDNFINTDKFNQIYRNYNNDFKENIAIKILKGYIKIDDIELEKVKDCLWKKYMDSYRKLLKMDSFNPTIILLDKNVINTINYLKSTNEFKKLYEETELYLENVKRYWKENKDNINKYLKCILKVNINTHLDVYISHPNCYEGYSFGDNKIAWGHYKGIEDPNYNLVYLVHEGLHHILPFEDNDSELVCNIKHSIIELASDYELYSLLKGESTLKDGHSYLEEYKEFIYPYWLKYIGLDNNQIQERIQRDNINKLIEVEDNNISNMNINEFVSFCTSKYLNAFKNRKR